MASASSALQLLHCPGHFQNLVRSTGQGDRLAAFARFGWDTADQFALAAGSPPSAVTRDTLGSRVLRPLFGTGWQTTEPDGSQAILRLHQSCVTLRETAAGHALAIPRPSPSGHDERAARRLQLQERLLSGITCSGLFQHANRTENEFERMLQKNSFHHIPLGECISLDQEAARDDRCTNVPTLDAFSPEGIVRQLVEGILPASPFLDIYHVKCALQRRAMAADVAGVCCFEAYDTVQAWLLQWKLEAPPRPEHGARRQALWQPNDWADLLEADRVISAEIAKATASQCIRRDSAGSPVARAIPGILAMPSLHRIMIRNTLTPPARNVRGKGQGKGQAAGTDRPRKRPERSPSPARPANPPWLGASSAKRKRPRGQVCAH